jgi:hypothetical protein
MHLRFPEVTLPPLSARAGMAVVLAASLMLSACAPLMTYRQVDAKLPMQQSLTRYHDMVRITKVDGSRIEGSVWRMDDGGLELSGHPYVPRNEIALVEKHEPVPGAIAARNTGIVIGAAATLVLLPFAVLLSKSSKTSAPNPGAPAARAAAVGAPAASSAGDGAPGATRGAAQSP